MLQNKFFVLGTFVASGDRLIRHLNDLDVIDRSAWVIFSYK